MKKKQKIRTSNGVPRVFCLGKSCLSFEKKNIEHGGRMTFSQMIEKKILRQNKFGLRKKIRTKDKEKRRKNFKYY